MMSKVHTLALKKELISFERIWLIVYISIKEAVFQIDIHHTFMFVLCDLTTTISQQHPHNTHLQLRFQKYAGDKWLNHGTIMQE